MTSISEGQPLKQGLFQQTQWSFEFQVYTYIYIYVCVFSFIIRALITWNLQLKNWKNNTYLFFLKGGVLKVPEPHPKKFI